LPALTVNDREMLNGVVPAVTGTKVMSSYAYCDGLASFLSSFFFSSFPAGAAAGAAAAGSVLTTRQ